MNAPAFVSVPVVTVCVKALVVMAAPMPSADAPCASVKAFAPVVSNETTPVAGKVSSTVMTKPAVPELTVIKTASADAGLTAPAAPPSESDQWFVLSDTLPEPPTQYLFAI